MNEIRVIHLADIHLGYTGPSNLILGEHESHPGRYVREIDIDSSVVRLVKQIQSAVPPISVVLIAGDLFHLRTPLPPAIQRAAWMVKKLVENDTDVVIIDGNHETSSRLHAGNATAYLRHLGAHVVNGNDWKIIHGDAWRNTSLRGQLAVHALPYRAILDGKFAGLRPMSGVLNVLLAHGRVQGMPETNSFGERAVATITPELLRRGWDFIALGDWHIPRRRPLTDAPAYYAGSLEALNYGEAEEYPPSASDENARRGALDVRLIRGTSASISTLENVGRRPVYRLNAIDANDLEPDALMQLIRERLDSGMNAESLVMLQINNCPNTVYERLNFEEIDRLRKLVRRCDIRPDIKYPEFELNSETQTDNSLAQQWQDYLKQMVNDETERDWLIEQGLAQIDAARSQARVH